MRRQHLSGFSKQRNATIPHPLDVAPLCALPSLSRSGQTPRTIFSPFLTSPDNTSGASAAILLRKLISVYLHRHCHEKLSNLKAHKTRFRMPPRRRVTSRWERHDRFPSSARFPPSDQWNPPTAARFFKMLTDDSAFWRKYRGDGGDLPPLVIPQRGPRPLPPPFADGPVVPAGSFYRKQPQEVPSIGNEEGRSLAYETVRSVARRLHREYQLRFVRMLGWGGLGAVALFDTRLEVPPDLYKYSFFAIKFPLDRYAGQAHNLTRRQIEDARAMEARSFRREKKYMAVCFCMASQGQNHAGVQLLKSRSNHQARR